MDNEKPKMFREGTGLLNDIAAQCVSDTQRWFGDKPHVSTINHQTLGLCGEVGEFANVVKKIDKGQLDLRDAKTKVRLAEEMADIFTYLMNLSGMLNIDMEKAYIGVRTNNNRRFTEVKKK